MLLSPQEIRVLGSLLEKEMTTPDVYPLSLNALQAACNQRSSRDPVVNYAEEEIRQALHGLEDLGLAGPARGSVGSASSRVTKYENHARTALQLRRDETAILCLLLLRGPQTPGDLRARADRLYAFEDLGSVVSTLERMAARPPAETAESMGGPLVAALPRTPGSREIRYIHLLGSRAEESMGTPTVPTTDEGVPEYAALLARLQELERRVARLEAAEDSAAALDGDA